MNEYPPLLCILLWLKKPRSLCICHKNQLECYLHQVCSVPDEVWEVTCYGQSHFKGCHLSHLWTWLTRLSSSSLPDELALLLVLVTGTWVMCLLGQDRKSLSDPGCQNDLTNAGLELVCWKGSLKRFSLTLIWRLSWLTQISWSLSSNWSHSKIVSFRGQNFWLPRFFLG